jgi:ribonuclease P protein component
MLSKKYRLDKVLFNEIFLKGSSFSSRNFIFKKINVPKEIHSRFAVSVPVKIAKKSSRRNYLRRKIYNVLFPVRNDPKLSVVGVIILKNDLKNLSTESLSAEIKELIKK